MRPFFPYYGSKWNMARYFPWPDHEHVVEPARPEEKLAPGGNDMAFPVLDRSQTPNETFQLGLTKRELFAAMAMQGIMAEDSNQNIHTVADLAVSQADALLKRLAK
jgi:hypothetical protein